jgi:hypothetical protein
MSRLGEQGLVIWWRGTRSGSTCRLGFLKERKAVGPKGAMRGRQIKVAVPTRSQQVNRDGCCLGRRLQTGQEREFVKVSLRIFKTYWMGNISLLNLAESHVNVVRYPLCVSSPGADNTNKRRDQMGMNHHISSLRRPIREWEGTTST